MHTDQRAQSDFIDEVVRRVQSAGSPKKGKAVASFAKGHVVRFAMLNDNPISVISQGIQKRFDDREFFSLAAIACLTAAEGLLLTALQGKWPGSFNFLLETGRQLASGSVGELEHLITDW